MVFPLKGKCVWVGRPHGTAGSALVRRLKHEDWESLTVDRATLLGPA